jgi:hypothetical protein
VGSGARRHDGGEQTTKSGSGLARRLVRLTGGCFSSDRSGLGGHLVISVILSSPLAACRWLNSTPASARLGASVLFNLSGTARTQPNSETVLRLSRVGNSNEESHAQSEKTLIRHRNCRNLRTGHFSSNDAFTGRSHHLQLIDEPESPLAPKSHCRRHGIIYG